jgi:hypothetical protein
VRAELRPSRTSSPRSFDGDLLDQSEAVGILGLAIYLLGGGANLCWALCAAAAVLLLLHQPRGADRLGDSRDLIRPDVKIG